ncbi:MAG: hypothetical protein BZ137_09820, partial [Methanosphaera sp. rholeuAM130]
GLTNGTYEVFVTYLGDEVFYPSENTTSFNVVKYNSSIVISDIDAVVGENVTVNVTGPSDANGNVEIIIGESKYTVVMSNGIATLNTTFAKHGIFTISAVYLGNDKYNGSINESLAVVHPVTTSIVVNAADIKVGENATVIVSVPSDATGIVTITVDGKSYNSTVFVGKAIFTIPDLINQTYNVVAEYSGDDKYDFNTNETTFNVF